MRDSEIEQWVINEIRLMTGSRLRELCVFSLQGVVNIKGTVQSRADKLAAQKAAKRGKGVVGVINQLNLRPRNLAQRRTGVQKQVVRASAGLHSPKHQPASSQVAN
jgi:osmotically-inducible protein OsmY